MCLTGKHGGNDCLLNPIGVVNDGLIELLIVKGRVGAGTMIRYMNQSTKEGGVQIYDENLETVRGRSFKLVSKRPQVGAKGANNPPHIFAIDGEVLYFQNTLKYEC